MVVTPDGGFFGTIGGGRLEYEVLAGAQTALAGEARNAEFRDWPFGPNLGQCCGGSVTILTEIFDSATILPPSFAGARRSAGRLVTAGRLGPASRMLRTILSGPASKRRRISRTPREAITTELTEIFGDQRTPVLLFGAGHVGRALVLALAPLPFAVRWIDSRADQFPQFVPANTPRSRHSSDPDSEIDRAPKGALIVVMTHSHPLDYAITAKALQRRDFSFVGLIGSRTKRARFASQAQADRAHRCRHRAARLSDRAREIKGKEPAVIAAAVTAQLLMAREQAANSDAR